MIKFSYKDKFNLYKNRKNGMFVNYPISKYIFRDETVKYLKRLMDKLNINL